MNCRRLMLESSYENTIPPITTVSATNFTIVPVPVNISLVLKKVVEIEEVQCFNINLWYIKPEAFISIFRVVLWSPA